MSSSSASETTWVWVRSSTGGSFSGGSRSGGGAGVHRELVCPNRFIMRHSAYSVGSVVTVLLIASMQFALQLGCNATDEPCVLRSGGGGRHGICGFSIYHSFIQRRGGY